MTTALSIPKRSTFRVTLTALTALIAVAMILPDAEARRLGGGRGFGRQSPNATQQQAQPPRDAQAQPPAQAAPAQPGMQRPPGQSAPNRWLGPLGGLAAGLGIAALLSHLGLIGPLAELLGGVLVVGLLALAAAAVWRLLRGAGTARPVRRAMEPAFSTAQAAGARPGSVAAEALAPAAPVGGAGSPRSWGIPSDFDADAFLRSAKVHFLRLQAAWDAKNLADIREFTTPEACAEIRMQMAEDGGTRNRTEVVTLEAELLGIEEGRDDYLASVRFSGSIREAEGEPAQPFEEVWNLSKPKTGRGGWLLAGLQQLSATDRPT